MAALQRPRTRTASTSVVETARGTHVFTIVGYRGHKGIGVGRPVRSATFAVGGYDWCVLYYPDGSNPENEGYVSVCVELQSKSSVVRALYDLWLTDRATGASSLIFSRPSPDPAFNSCNNDVVRGSYMFMERVLLETSPYLQDDCLVIECDVTVIKDVRPTAACGTSDEIQVPPPSDLSTSLAKLLEGNRGTDLTIEVDGEVFHAHKIVLAMRSPVFDAQLYGPMGDSERRCIEIEDMQPAVFRALLDFIYTDSLPAMDDLLDTDDNNNNNSNNNKEEVVKQLLVAADRYAMERMKLMCESILCNSLDAHSAVTTLALADQHHCTKLKDACIEYIKLFA